MPSRAKSHFDGLRESLVKEGVAQAGAAARFKVNQARTHLQNNVVWVNIVLNFTILF